MTKQPLKLAKEIAVLKPTKAWNFDAYLTKFQTSNFTL